jgi:hypothetical protein
VEGIGPDPGKDSKARVRAGTVPSESSRRLVCSERMRPRPHPILAQLLSLDSLLFHDLRIIVLISASVFQARSDTDQNVLAYCQSIWSPLLRSCSRYFLHTEEVLLGLQIWYGR